MKGWKGGKVERWKADNKLKSGIFKKVLMSPAGGGGGWIDIMKNK
jgi:hypothetical protein